MTNDGDALFRAICEQPWEDTPRLVYADWLEDTGIYNGREDADEARLRAAHIRYQIAWTRGERGAASDHFAVMFTTFVGCVERWGFELPRVPGVTWHAQFFHRGFAPGATVDLTLPFPDRAETVFHTVPISTLELTQATADNLPELLACEYLPRVSCLNIHGPIGDRGAALLAECPRLANLEELRVVNVGLGDSGLEALAHSPVLGNLCRLWFDANRITDKGAVVLLNPHALRNLKALGWRGNPLHQNTVGVLRYRYHDVHTGTIAAG